MRLALTLMACSSLAAAATPTSYTADPSQSRLEFTGVQLGFDYSVELPYALGSLDTRINYLDTERLLSQIGSASPESLAGELLTGITKRKGTVDFLYGYHGFTWDWQGQYIGPANFNNQNTSTTFNVLGVQAWWLINSTLGYKFDQHASVHFIINNVFNKQPPYPALAGAQGNFTPAVSEYFQGIIGRSMILGADYKF